MSARPSPPSPRGQRPATPRGQVPFRQSAPRINKPELILADEPTGNLDEENSQIIADLLFNVSKKYQKSLCLVTHDLELAKKCDRLMKIDNGTII